MKGVVNMDERTMNNEIGIAFNKIVVAKMNLEDLFKEKEIDQNTKEIFKDIEDAKTSLAKVILQMNGPL
jgi:hypothetical protein